MITRFNNRDYTFVPWRPALGRVFGGSFTFDCETTLIDQDQPWLTPAYVLGAAFDGERGVFVPRDRLAAFLAAHAGNTVVFHNAPFDLDVIATAAPATNVYDRVDRNEVYDTQLMHRLLTLGEDGHIAAKKGESTLEHCAAVYLGVDLPKDVKDADGDPIRLSYGKWLNRPPGDMDPLYLEYLAADVVATWQVFTTLRDRTRRLLDSAAGVWGFVSDAWLRKCQERYGLQTHHIQLKAAIVLRAITANGLHLDTARRAELAEGLRARLKIQEADLRRYGYLPGGKGSNKSLQAAMRARARACPWLAFPLTETGQFTTARDALQDLAGKDPFVKLLLEYQQTKSLLGSFIDKMARPVLHPSFNVLTRSGRTSSFGEINAHNLPAVDEVRACFVPSPGHEFIDADYATIELATLSQASMTQFNLDSKMAAAINAGEDLHKLVAGTVLGKPPGDVSKPERQKAKPVNFGKPGGMGAETLIGYAWVKFGVHLNLEEAEALSEAWFDLFPEMRDFLSDTTDTAAELAALLDLTPASHVAATGDNRFAGHPENAHCLDRPNAILACMLMKVVKEPNPSTQAGNPYPASDCDYFWSKLDEVAHLLPSAQRKAVRARCPSRKLQRAVMNLAGRAGVFTLSGRLRAHATYTARHNAIFQGLASDGAKLALWRLWRADYRIVNFIHDEVLIEVPAGTAQERLRHALVVRQHMIDAMSEFVPDVRIEVKYAATTRWYKDAEAVLDSTGTGLLLWEPPPNHGAEHRASSA